MYIERTDPRGVSAEALGALVRECLEGRAPRRALLAVPDITRLHSGAGPIAALFYQLLEERGCRVDAMPAVGTHAPMTRDEAARMYPGIPFDRFLAHDWRRDVVRLGEVPADFLREISGGLWDEPIAVEVNRRVVDPEYDLVVSVGQVVPHEVAGMANHAKNLFVGLGGSEMIHKSHMLGAVCGLESAMGRDHAPVRRVFDYALEKYFTARPPLFVMTVMSGGACKGVFAGDTRRALESAVALSRRENILRVPGGIQRCVAWLDPSEFRSTWLGNKAVYRARLAIRDGGSLLILAPGVKRFGEDDACDALIRRYGYKGRLRTLALLRDPACGDLRANQAAAAHMIHGSSDGRFEIAYAAPGLSRAEVEGVGYRWADYAAAVARYDPAKLRPGFNTLPDGEEIYFIPNPALGLWTR